MFEQAIPVDATDAGARTDPRIRGVIEPVSRISRSSRRSSRAPEYAVSLRYKVTATVRTGRWSTAGRSPAGAAKNEGLLPSGEEALRKAVRLALRDAGAKLATELRDQAVVRGLLPASDAAPVQAE